MFQGDAKRERLLIATLVATSALTINAGAIIAPSLPGLHEHFRDVPHAMMMTKLVLTITSLAIALCAPLAGWFADRVGRKILLVSTLVLCAIAGTSGLYAQSLQQILIGRVVLGFAVAGIMTAVTTLIGDYFTGSRRNLVIGLQGAVLGFGGVLLLVGGGYLAEWGWRYPFALYVVALIFLPAVILFIDEPDRHQRLDAGDVTSASEHHHPLALVAVLYGSAMFVQIVFYMVPVELPFFLESMGIVKPSVAGSAMALLVLVAAFTALLYRRIKQIASYTLILSITFFTIAVGYTLLCMATDLVLVLVSMVVTGAGLGLLLPNLTAWTMARTAPVYRGRVIGGLTMSVFIGQFLSPIVTAPIIAAVGIDYAYLVVGIAIGIAALPFGFYGVMQGRRAIQRTKHEQ